MLAAGVSTTAIGADPVFLWPCWSALLDFDPLLLLVAFLNCFTEQNFTVPIGKRGEGARRAKITRGDVAVEGPETLLKSVGESFGMTSRIIDISPRLIGDQ